jgi:hypothetical protein
VEGQLLQGKTGEKEGVCFPRTRSALRLPSLPPHCATASRIGSPRPHGVHLKLGHWEVIRIFFLVVVLETKGSSMPMLVKNGSSDQL